MGTHGTCASVLFLPIEIPHQNPMKGKANECFGCSRWTDAFEPMNTPALLGGFYPNKQECFFYEMFVFLPKNQ